ncbi:MAG: CCA tRNA nucleotidyltransferase [Alphaproteobacteria bacterium]|nr:CCA tRNA nucleotidyltransferase [Alphaproteobacteria bacterium]
MPTAPSLANAPWLIRLETRAVMTALTRAGFEVRCVGGCVRDALNSSKNFDIDMATTARPEQTVAALEKSGIKAIPTGIAHGTVTAVINHTPFEITTLRKDIACDGRHAEVAYTDRWEEDAARRDFTINALSCDADGRVYDYFDGIADLEAGRVRFIGDAEQRIREDHLRILRFFRFTARFGKSTDRKGLSACKKHAAMLAELSGERIQQEMLKLFATPHAADILETMARNGILAPIIQGKIYPDMLRALATLEKSQKVEFDAVRHLAALLAPGEKDAARTAETLAIRWRLSNAHRTQLLTLLTHDIPQDADERAQKRLLRALGTVNFVSLALIGWAAHPKTRTYASMLKLSRSWKIPAFPVKGSDLLEQGFESGKALGATLLLLEQVWEASDYTLTKKELLKRLK